MSFSDRYLRSSKDDADFEQLVYECLPPGPPGAAWEPRIHRGPDGAADLVCEAGEELIIAECKVISGQSAAAAFREWAKHWHGNKRSAGLKDRLREAASQGNMTRYPSWLNESRVLTMYYFCVSCAMTYEKSRELANIIKADLSSLPTLPHLGRIAVEVRTWRDFKEILSVESALRYRWFGFPKGILPLEEEAPQDSFRHFLTQDGLPYVARRQAPATGGKDPEWRDEDALLQALELRDTEPCLLLYGPGGAGKTRLAFELARALKASGWEAYRLESNAGSDAVQTLLRANRQPCRVILILDYAENADASAVASAVRAANASGAHIVRLLAICRSSAVSDVHSALEGEKLPIGVAGSNQTEFGYWVVRKILEHGGLQNNETVVRACEDLPVLAAFAVYLWAQAPKQYADQFGHLLGVSDFQTWVRRRVAVLAAHGPSGPAARQIIAEIAISMPMDEHQLGRIINTGGEEAWILESLRTDRWIENGATGLVAAHDLFADALVAQFVFEIPGRATDRLTGLLRRADTPEELQRRLRSVDRLGGHPRAVEVNGLDIVRTLLRAHPHGYAAGEKILKGRLLSAVEKILLLATDNVLRELVTADRLCDSAVYGLADDIIRKRSLAGLPEVARGVLAELLRSALQRGTDNNRGLRVAFQVNPTRFYQALLSSIKSCALDLETHFLLSAGIEESRKGHLPPSVKGELLEAAFAWLAVHREHWWAGRLVRVLADEQALPIQPLMDILAWCGRFASHPDALFRLARLKEKLLTPGAEQTVVDVGVDVIRQATRSRSLPIESVFSVWLVLDDLCELHRKGFVAAGVASLYRDWLRMKPPHLPTDSVFPQLYGNFCVDKFCYAMENGFFDPQADEAALAHYVNWINSWPAKARSRGLLELVSVTHLLPFEVPPADTAAPGVGEEPDGDQVQNLLHQLTDYSIPPSRWTALFEMVWTLAPGSRPVVLEGKRWLRAVKPDPAWTWVWEPLFLADPNDSDLQELALWWLRERGPRNRGAWAWIWQLLWDSVDRPQELITLGHEWLAEQVALPKPCWWLVMDRLTGAGALADDIAQELLRKRHAALPSEPDVPEM